MGYPILKFALKFGLPAIFVLKRAKPVFHVIFECSRVFNFPVFSIENGFPVNSASRMGTDEFWSAVGPIGCPLPVGFAVSEFSSVH